MVYKGENNGEKSFSIGNRMDKSTKIYPVGGPISQEKTKVWYHVRLDAEKSQQQYSLPKMEVKTSVYPHDYVSFVSTISISKKTKKKQFPFYKKR